MRWILVALGLLLAPAAQAGPGTALPTLFGSLVGGAAGALVGAPIYGAIDPYHSDDGAEWLVIGAPMGFGVGAAVGGTVGHAMFGGHHKLAVGLVSGTTAVAGGVLLGLTPGLYTDFSDNRFAVAWVTGTSLAVVGTPLAATLTSLFTGHGGGARMAVLATPRGFVVVGTL